MENIHNSLKWGFHLFIGFVFCFCFSATFTYLLKTHIDSVSIWFCLLFSPTLCLFFSSLTSITFFYSPPAASPLAFPPLFSLYQPSSSIPAISFLSSISAAFPSLPSQSASHCCLHGVVMVTMATDFKWRVAHKTALGVCVCGGGGYRGKGTTVVCSNCTVRQHIVKHHCLLSLPHPNVHTVHVNIHTYILLLLTVWTYTHTHTPSHALNRHKEAVSARVLELRGLTMEMGF